MLSNFRLCPGHFENLCHMAPVCAQSLSRVQLFATPWAVAHHTSLSMDFFRQEYWSGLPFPASEDLPDLGIKPMFLGSPADPLPLCHLASWFCLNSKETVDFVLLCSIVAGIQPGLVQDTVPNCFHSCFFFFLQYQLKFQSICSATWISPIYVLLSKQCGTWVVVNTLVQNL